MRPGDLYFLLVPPPAGVGAFLTQRGWVAAIVVATVVTLLGVLIRVVNFFIGDAKRAGGYTAWQKERYGAVPEREMARDTELRGEEGRRMIKLEGKQQRREFKRRNSTSAAGQMRFHL
jgi:hypothetical protein